LDNHQNSLLFILLLQMNMQQKRQWLEIAITCDGSEK